MAPSPLHQRLASQIPPFTQPLPSKANQGSSFSHRSLNVASGLRAFQDPSIFIQGFSFVGPQHHGQLSLPTTGPVVLHQRRKPLLGTDSQSLHGLPHD